MTKTYRRPEKLFGRLAVSFASILATTTWAAGGEESARANDGEWSFTRLGEYAERLAASPFIASSDLPPVLRELDYDSYRLIAFRHEKAIWKADDLPFWLEAFHRGYLYGDQVALNLVEGGRIKTVPFDRELFHYWGKLTDLAVPDDLGFAGFRVLGRFETSPHPLEIASFLGTNYFRAIGPGQWYGTSARGLAVNIGLPKAEEFPVFRAFWIERPEPNETHLRIGAMLDSSSVAGAYWFDLQPGAATRMDVTARLFFRRQPEKIGLAPMTSMWMWGDGRAGPDGDPRPEVHDADGLLIRTDEGQWIWRPLTRLGYPSLSGYDLRGIRGFGLLQRDRDWANYRDDEAKYDRRPSVWIEPRDGWGRGRIELLELPAPHEGIDNIAAWWTPAEAVTPGKPLDLSYSVSFMSAEPKEHHLGRAIATRVDRRDGRPVRVEVNFTGESLNGVSGNSVEPKVLCQRGEVSNVRVEPESEGSCRLCFDVRPNGAEPLELSAVLQRGQEALTETWRYLCPISQE